ncbi:MAG: hypothetical protein AAFP08_09260, partial [Bacteroidota bacterium]
MNKTLLLLSLALLSFGFSWTELSDVLILDNDNDHLYDTDTERSGAPFRVVSDTLPPIQDRSGDYINDPNRNPVDLADPPVIRQTVEYDPASGRYIVRETMGNFEFRPPTYLTTEEYFAYRREQDQAEYFRRLGGVGIEDQITFDDPLADVDIEESLINRLFGSNEIDIRPQGGVDLTFAYDRQLVKNPFLIQRQQGLA